MQHTMTTPQTQPISATLIGYYEAIERASADMLSAARSGDWDAVMKLEGACAVLISQLKAAADVHTLHDADRKTKARIMQRILLNDAEIRYLAEPWLEQLDGTLSGRSRALH